MAISVKNLVGLACVLLVAAAMVLAPVGDASAREKREKDDYVLGTVRLDSGFYMYVKVYPISIVGDQFFNYWLGESEGRAVLLDPFSQVWYMAPVQYQRTKLVFRGQELEGFVRVWGQVVPFIDGNYIFGVDGMVYKLVKEYRRIGPAGKKKKRVKSAYYVNLTTGEQSNWPLRTEDEITRYESFVGSQESGWAFPSWANGASAEEPPVSMAPLEEPPEEAPPVEVEPQPEGDEGEAAETEEAPAEADSGEETS